MQGKSRIREKGFETVEKIGVIGAFGFDALKETTGGQPVKTRTLYYSLCEKYGRDNVLCVETYRWKKNPVKMILELMLVIRKCNAIILLPAQNGIKVFLNVLLNTKKKNTRLYYDVIGGWIAEKANGDLNLLNQLKMLDGIWVETSSMKNDLSKIGILNTEVIPNFKNIQKLELSDLPKAHNEPYYFCTFSRVMEEKGITQALDLLKVDGRLCVISFQSLEDKIVKNKMNEVSEVKEEIKKLPFIPDEYLPNFKIISKGITPSKEELEENYRSHSARLRVIERIKP